MTDEKNDPTQLLFYRWGPGAIQDASERARFTRELGKRRDRVYGGSRIRA